MNANLYPSSYSGTELRRRRIADSVLTEYAYPPETRIGKHSHARPYFNLILEGAYDETHGGRVRECRPAMLFFHPEGESHSDRPRKLARPLAAFKTFPTFKDVRPRCGSLRGGG